MAIRGMLILLRPPTPGHTSRDMPLTGGGIALDALPNPLPAVSLLSVVEMTGDEVGKTHLIEIGLLDSRLRPVLSSKFEPMVMEELATLAYTGDDEPSPSDFIRRRKEIPVPGGTKLEPNLRYFFAMKIDGKSQDPFLSTFVTEP